MLLDADRVQVCIVVCERLGREIARRRGRRHPDLVSESMVQHRVCVCAAHMPGARTEAQSEQRCCGVSLLSMMSPLCVCVWRDNKSK